LEVYIGNLYGSRLFIHASSSEQARGEEAETRSMLWDFRLRSIPFPACAPEFVEIERNYRAVFMLLQKIEAERGVKPMFWGKGLSRLDAVQSLPLKITEYQKHKTRDDKCNAKSSKFLPAARH
jgi:hypothetical protein